MKYLLLDNFVVCLYHGSLLRRTFRFRTNLGGQTAQIAQLLASPLLARCLAFQETTQRRQDQILMDHKVLDLVAMLLLPFLMGIYKVTDTKLALAL